MFRTAEHRMVHSTFLQSHTCKRCRMAPLTARPFAGPAQLPVEPSMRGSSACKRAASSRACSSSGFCTTEGDMARYARSIMRRTTQFDVSRRRYFHSDAADRDQRPSQSRDNARNEHASPWEASYNVRADRVLLDQNLHYLSPSKCHQPHHQVLRRNAHDFEARDSTAERHVQCDWRPADVVQSLGVLRGILTALRKEEDGKRDEIGLVDLMWKRDGITTQPGQRGSVWLDRDLLEGSRATVTDEADLTEGNVYYIDVPLKHRDVTTPSHRLAAPTEVSLSDVAPLIGLALSADDRERLDEEALLGQRGSDAGLSQRHRKSSIHDEPTLEDLEQAERQAQDVSSHKDRERWVFGREGEHEQEREESDERPEEGAIMRNDVHGDLLPAQGQDVVVRLLLQPSEQNNSDSTFTEHARAGKFKPAYVPRLSSGAGGLTFLQALMRFGRSESLEDLEPGSSAHARPKVDFKLGGGFSGAFKLPQGHVLRSPPNENFQARYDGKSSKEMSVGNRTGIQNGRSGRGANAA